MRQSYKPQSDARKPAKPQSSIKKRTKTKLIIFASVVTILAVMVADSNLRLTVSRYSAGTARLPQAFEGFKIAHLSDLHGALFGKNGEYLFAEVRKLSPDIIAVTGDFVSDYKSAEEKAKELEVTRLTLAGLMEIAPVYVISGNHDWGAGLIDELAEIFTETGAVYLRNEYITLERGNAGDGTYGRVILAGVEDPNSYAGLKSPQVIINRAREEYPDDYIILLGHRNYWVEKYPTLDCDLILCGHGHGGLIRLPFAGGLFDNTHRTLWPKYEDGMHESGAYQMVVSRGLGGFARFLNNPEIGIITLTKNEKSS